MTIRYVYAVWVQTDDFYDDGQWSSLYASREAAGAEAAALLGTHIDGVGTVTKTLVDEVPLRDTQC